MVEASRATIILYTSFSYGWFINCSVIGEYPVLANKDPERSVTIRRGPERTKDQII
jgi:hypothetical protein